MKEPVPVILVVEDVLSEGVLRRILDVTRGRFLVTACLGKEGFGFIRKNLPVFNRVAPRSPFVILTDLDTNPCPSGMLREWFSEPLHPNLIIRVAVREVEAWLLADRRGFARFAGIGLDAIPRDVEAIEHPKEFLIGISRRGHARIRGALVPREGKSARVGPDYNGCLLRFTHHHWSVRRAAEASPSLARACRALAAFRPMTDG